MDKDFSIKLNEFVNNWTNIFWSKLELSNQIMKSTNYSFSLITNTLDDIKPISLKDNKLSLKLEILVKRFNFYGFNLTQKSLEFLSTRIGISNSNILMTVTAIINTYKNNNVNNNNIISYAFLDGLYKNKFISPYSYTELWSNQKQHNNTYIEFEHLQENILECQEMILILRS